MSSTRRVELQVARTGPMSLPASNGVQRKKNRPNPARRKANQASLPNVKGSEEVKTVKQEQVSTKAVTVSSQSVSSSTIVKQVQPSVQTPTGKAARTPKSKQNTSTKSSNQGPSKSSKSSTSKPSPTPSTLVTTPAVLTTGGLLGCVASGAILLGAGLWKDIAGSSAAILTVRTAKHCVNNILDELIAHLNAGTYNAPEALDILRRTTLAYAIAIPGGAAFVERVFREVEMVRVRRAKEVDAVVKEACRELVEVGKGGASAKEEKVGVVVGRHLVRLSDLAGGAARDVLERNPAVLRDARRTVEDKPGMKVPTVKVNMVVRQTK